MSKQGKVEQVGTEEGNVIIAKFMGAKKDGGATIAKDGSFTDSFTVIVNDEKISWFDKETENWSSASILKYHTDWSWLMPVVGKIEALGFQFFIHNEGAYMRKWHYKGNFPDFGNVGTTKIEAVYKTIVEFIQWHKQQSLTP